MHVCKEKLNMTYRDTSAYMSGFGVLILKQYTGVSRRLYVLS